MSDIMNTKNKRSKMIDNIIIFTSLLAVTGLILKMIVRYIENQEEKDQKWTMPIRNWSMTISQLCIHFSGRLDNALNL